MVAVASEEVGHEGNGHDDADEYDEQAEYLRPSGERMNWRVFFRFEVPPFFFVVLVDFFRLVLDLGAFFFLAMQVYNSISLTWQFSLRARGYQGQLWCTRVGGVWFCVRAGEALFSEDMFLYPMWNVRVPKGDFGE